MNHLIPKLFILLCFFISSLSAASLYINPQIGRSNFDAIFKSSTQYGGSFGVLFENGLMLEGSLLVNTAESHTNGYDDLSMTAGLAGAQYSFLRDDFLSPYVGAFFGFASLSANYDNNPSVIYGAKAGLNFMIFPYLQPFIESSYMSIDNALSLDITPITVSAGIRFCFYSDSIDKPTKSRLSKKQRRRNIQRRPFRKPPPEPRRPY